MTNVLRYIFYSVTRIARADAPADFSTMKVGSFRDVYQFCAFCDDKADFFGRYGTTETFHFAALAVNAKFRRRGLGAVVFKAAIDLVRCLGLPVAYIKGEASSNYSRKIYEKFGFENLLTQSYDDYTVDGEIVIQGSDEHKSMTIFGIKVV